MKGTVLAFFALVACVVDSRKLLPAETGCFRVKDKKACCDAIDSRFTTDGNTFGGQRCLPSSKKKFSSGNVCEPENWVDEKSSRRAAAAICGDEGMVATASHKFAMIARNLPSTFSLPDPSEQGTQVVLILMALMIPIVVTTEATDYVMGKAIQPGSATDNAAGKGLMIFAYIVIGFLLSGAFGLRF